MRALRAIFKRHQDRLARLTAIAGILVVGSLVLRSAPRAVQVVFDLGPKHSEFVEVRVAYVQDGEELHGVAFSFPEGAPLRVNHSVNLPAGDFEVHTELRPLHGEWLASIEHLHTPIDGPVRIRLPTGQR
jgi:hypothetical protein